MVNAVVCYTNSRLEAVQYSVTLTTWTPKRNIYGHPFSRLMGNRAAVKLFNIPLLQSAALANLYTDFSCLAEGRRLSWPEYTVGYLKKRPIRVEPAPTLSTACTVVNMHASAQCTRHEPSKRFSPASAKRAVKSHESCSANLQLLYTVHRLQPRMNACLR